MCRHFSGKSHHGAAWPGDTGLLGRAATALRCSFGAAPSEVVAAGGRGEGGLRHSLSGRGPTPPELLADWLPAAAWLTGGVGQAGAT